MSMTKRDFNAIAAALSTARAEIARLWTYEPADPVTSALDVHADLVRGIARHCAATNPNFDAARFRRACGLED